MNKSRFLECFIDDFKVAHLYIYKPYNNEVVKQLHLYKNNQMVANSYHFELENNDYYKYTIDIDYSYGDVYCYRHLNTTFYFNIRHITHTEKFDRDFFYDKNDLGPSYSKLATSFKIWAPLADKVEIVTQGERYLMKKGEKGIFSTTVFGDLKNVIYHVETTRNGVTTSSNDPYAYSSTENGFQSVVVDVKKAKPVKPSNVINSYCDAIIYEMSVRDFSIDDNSGIFHKMKFKGLVEKGTSLNGYSTGLDYLKELGITHVQLMPVMDFESVDETNYLNQYNWGYDPLQFNTVEGSYCVNTYEGRVTELQDAVAEFHRNNIRVNLDLVFNHVYNDQHYAFNRIMPYYCLRYHNDETKSDGAYCGNELRTDGLMYQKYLCDMLKRYIEIYDIDGIRLDLMGLIDNKTILKFVEIGKKYKKDFMVYGEGWNLPSCMSEELRATVHSHRVLPEVGFFNAHFRDSIKGGSMKHQAMERGYVMGNLDCRDGFKKGMGGSFDRFDDAIQTINYLECHDNLTFYDKAVMCFNESNNDIIPITKLSLALTILAIGVPFIHGGEEFLRTKQGHDNSYNLPDEINHFDWERRCKLDEVVKYTAKMIEIRKKYPVFRIHNKEEVEKRISFEDYYEISIMNADDLKLFVNVTQYDFRYDLNKYDVIFSDIEQDEAGVVKIPPHSIVIVKK